MPIEDGTWEDHLEEDDELLDPPATEADLRDQFIHGPVSVDSSAQSSTEPPQSSETEESQEAEPSEDEIPEFPDEFKQDFEGLLYLGRLTDSFTWLGHDFVIRSLNTGDLTDIGLLHKKYTNTLADVAAYQALIVAASIVSVDGKSLPQPLTRDSDDTALLNAFNHVLRWYKPTIDHVYQKIMELESKVDSVIEALAKGRG